MDLPSMRTDHPRGSWGGRALLCPPHGLFGHVAPGRSSALAEPGQVVIEVAGLNDDTVFALQKAIAQTWATAISENTFRDPGQPGVRLRLYADLRQVLAQASPPHETLVPRPQ
jgi:hypothetical protein